jgi:hypothetical protein
MATEEPYWTSREAAAWIGTQEGAVHASAPEETLAPDDLGRALSSLIARCCDGRIRAVGRRCEWPPWYLKYEMNIVAQTRWLNAGRPSDRFQSIPAYEWSDLEWSSSSGELVLQSKVHRRIEWVTLQFSRSDLMREWPANAKSGSARTRGRKPKIFEGVKTKMIEDIKLHGSERLKEMREKQLSADYGCSRNTARLARRAALAETAVAEQVKNSIPDK